jgi:uncharacterized lipoprotein YmbA
MKHLLILILALGLTACGGSSETAQSNPFQEVLGKALPTQPTVPAPTDPFAPVLKKNGG